LARPAHVHHSLSRSWFAGVRRWYTTPLTEAAFLRLTMNPQVSGRPVSYAEAAAVLAAWRAVRGHAFLADNASLTDPVIDPTVITGYRQVSDFHLINLAARHGIVLATLDATLPLAVAPADRKWVEIVR
jgi:toxin-antitoxin system PIN domain toxin